MSVLFLITDAIQRNAEGVKFNYLLLLKKNTQIFYSTIGTKPQSLIVTKPNINFNKTSK